MNHTTTTRAPFIVGIGGTTRPGSSTESALRATLQYARQLGAETRLFGGEALAALEGYSPEQAARSAGQQAIVDAVRAADAVIFASPGYHGGVSGLVKNAIDLLEDLRGDPRVYLDGMPVGCIVTAAGWQGCNTTLGALRSIVHALRGWPTPLGVTLNTAGVRLFDGDGQCLDEQVAGSLKLLAEQVVGARRLPATNRP
ncbi:NADPH-dependent FMN reductase [Massilia dura]|uniref:NADPH-dependent FMN reductase n=1 Tax=Pseudoduganella dura TaxID=321982 RepID=A0A6I3X419_9BURK|nr:NAD(P)H-dependent oxidoreductase [Pseudoduganella dura]MUI10977.1 NADPH-dependent FMN reductase [Pseudoduganella dura]GGY13327.1 NADPH-dependent oxidoreductase [Pseudoduganella dura]